MVVFKYMSCSPSEKKFFRGWPIVKDGTMGHDTPIYNIIYDTPVYI
jgi:hypothetical protein